MSDKLAKNIEKATRSLQDKGMSEDDAIDIISYILDAVIPLDIIIPNSIGSRLELLDRQIIKSILKQIANLLNDTDRQDKLIQSLKRTDNLRQSLNNRIIKR